MTSYEVYNENHIETWNKSCILPFPEKGELEITDNYRGTTLTSIATKIYNTMILIGIQPAMETILGKNQNGFSEKQVRNRTYFDHQNNN